MLMHPTMTKREQALWEAASPAFERIGMPDPAVDSADLWRSHFRLHLLAYLLKRGYRIEVLFNAPLPVLAGEVVKASEEERRRSATEA